MTVIRDRIYMGILYLNPFSVDNKETVNRWNRPIIFENFNRVGVDLIYDVQYPIEYSANSQLNILKPIIPIGEMLRSMGYPEQLNENHLKEIVNKRLPGLYYNTGIYQKMNPNSSSNKQTYDKQIEGMIKDFVLLDEEIIKNKNKEKIFRY